MESMQERSFAMNYRIVAGHEENFRRNRLPWLIRCRALTPVLVLILLILTFCACSNGVSPDNPDNDSTDNSAGSTGGGATNGNSNGGATGTGGSSSGSGGAVTTDDADGDGLPTAWEIQHGLNDHDASDAFLDNDVDFLNNLAEFRAGTDPQNSDSDGDQVPDGVEVDIQVDPTVPDAHDVVSVCESGCDFTLISSALAGGKHFIRVKVGAYSDHFLIGKDRHVFSEAGAESTAVIADVEDHVVNMNPNSSLHGLSLSNGKALLGGGVYAAPLGVIIRKNIIRNNSAVIDPNGSVSGFGGGVYVYSQGSVNYTARIVENDIHHNTALWGAGIDVSDYSYVAISGNRVHENLALSAPSPAGTSTYQALGAGAFISEFAYARCFNNIFYRNSAPDGKGGGIYAGFNNIVINNTVVGNSAVAGSGVSATAMLIGNIIWNNAPLDVSTDAVINMQYSIVNGGFAGLGNLDADPLFVNSDIDDFRLQQDSPAIDNGSRGVCNNNSQFTPCVDSAVWDQLLLYGLTLDRDFRGVFRPLDGDVQGAFSGDGSDYDIGAYEFIPAPPQ